MNAIWILFSLAISVFAYGVGSSDGGGVPMGIGFALITWLILAVIRATFLALFRLLNPRARRRA